MTKKEEEPRLGSVLSSKKRLDSDVFLNGASPAAARVSLSRSNGPYLAWRPKLGPCRCLWINGALGLSS